ncbi:MAG: PDZ domain-containing protein [Chloroflexi bacterium]|nr:PDZ domain-containing protein [Chloroflexota bacterium]
MRRFWPTVCALAGLALLVTGCTSRRPSAALPPTGTPIAVVAATTAIPPAPPATAAAPAPTRAPGRPAPLSVVVETLPTATPIGAALRRQVFNEVWNTINEKYLYPDFGGVDWAAVRDEFAPRIETAPSDEAFFTLLSEMVGRLRDDHSRFLPPSAAQREDLRTTGREAQVGIGVIGLPLSDGLLIQHVFPASPAERAGLRARDRIVAIDGAFYADGDIQGPVGSQVRLTVVRPGAQSRDIVITRRHVEGRIGPTALRLAGDIGYLSVTTLWVADMDQQVSEALSTLTTPAPVRGLILDLRSNPGGWRSVMTGILGHFVAGEVGSFTSRMGDMPLVIKPGAVPDLRGIPLVVLVDETTASYAEVIAAVLQRRAGAVVVGAPTAGNTETIYSYELSGGARLWVAQEGFRLSDGASLEGVGVQPDILALDDWTRFSLADDPGIGSALKLLNRSAGGQ